MINWILEVELVDVKLENRVLQECLERLKEVFKREYINYKS